MLVIRKIWRPLFSSNTRFEIRPFALLLTEFSFLCPNNLQFSQKKATENSVFPSN